MLQDERQTQVYSLFDHSYAGGSWNGAMIEQAAVLKKRAETAEAEVKRLRPVVDAFFEYRKHVYCCGECGDGDPCEESGILYSVAVTAVDSVCGKPQAQQS